MELNRCLRPRSLPMPRKRAQKGKPGRQAEVLKVDGDWKDAVSRALKRGKPPEQRTKGNKKKK